MNNNISDNPTTSNHTQSGICITNQSHFSRPHSPIDEHFTDGHFWTPQTVMLRTVRDWVHQTSFNPQTGLSIDRNPEISRMVRRRWPQIKLQEACYPKHDAQRLTAFDNESLDLVYSHQVLEHIPKPWLAGAEMVRVLAVGGVGIHTTCAYNPRHGPPSFNDYYRFLPDGLAQLFDGVDVLVKGSWGNRQVLAYNLTMSDGHGRLGGRRFHPMLAAENDPDHPWVTWIIFQKR